MNPHLIFVKYNRDRLPQYRTETTIWSEPDGRKVRKRSLSLEGHEHIKKVIKGGHLLQDRLHRANLPSMRSMKDGVEFDFIEGRSLEQILLSKANEDDQEGFRDLLLAYKGYIIDLGSAAPGTGLRNCINELLSDVPTGTMGEMMPVANLDLTLDNIIMDDIGRYWITDHEWVFDSPVPRSFILYRGLYVLYLRQNERIERMLPFAQALDLIEVPEELREPYRLACERFIDRVFGTDRKYIVPERYRKEIDHLASRNELDTQKNELLSALRELEDTRSIQTELKGIAESREARLHEQEARLGTYAAEVERLKRESIERLGLLEQERSRSSMLEYDLDLERSLIARLNREKELNSESIAQMRRDLDMERAIVSRLTYDLESQKAQIRAEDDELVYRRLEAGKLERELAYAGDEVKRREAELILARAALSDLWTKHEEQFQRLQGMTDQFMGKQAELMTMSDWARSMQLQLDFLESIPTIRTTERMARNQKLLFDKLKAGGLIPTIKDIVRKYSPPQMQSMLDRKEPSNMEELESAAKDKDVLVVFPVIPWEFRWQRPQQLVTRFAGNGYIVIFVNMTLVPTEKRYLNEGEALEGVTLRRLRDSIYDVGLRTYGKLNVYHDRIKGSDLNNLSKGLASVLRHVEARSFTYMVQFPGWAPLAEMTNSHVPGTLVFDCMDDHAGFSNNATEVVKRETRLMERSDLVIASSAKLFEKASAFNDDTILVRNGTDFDMFHTLSPNGKLDSMRRPIIGYHGAISEWFDPEVVTRCAERHPEWNFVLIGSTLGCEVNGLKRLTNVHLLGEMPYKDLPGYLYYFDVCIIPFRVTPLTMATNPVKFYEYISSGKPVVSINLPEMQQYADCCYLYEGLDEFEDGIQKALAEKDEGLRAKRIELARMSSWDQRFRDVKMKLDELQSEQGPERRKRKVL